MGAANVPKYTVALAGNPNVGKSSLFNALTGLHHHTGNWAGKTVEISAGWRKKNGKLYEFIDLPGTYSLQGLSEDERLAASFVESGRADCIVVVCDGSALERNLILALQILQRAEKVILCINLMDEAGRQGICVDAEGLARQLGVPVVLTSAAQKQGLEELLLQIQTTVAGNPVLPYETENVILEAQALSARYVRQGCQEAWRVTLDRLLLSRRRGIPILFALLTLILVITVWGANYPSALLERFFAWAQGWLWLLLQPLPDWLRGILVEGVFGTCGQVLAVMLPPMAIFFPLFTLLEDVGYLPRMAYLLDGPMGRCGGCGKQALTLCMGLGCNAVAVTGSRIIESPRERLQAILTNAMVPCNGRFPALIWLAAIFCPLGFAALGVLGAVLLGILGAMVTSGILSRTALKHTPSTFLLELPPLRRPQVGQILLRSVLDRTIQVALRALTVAAPAGAVLWILSHTRLLPGLTGLLEPLGRSMGMNGVILAAFLLAFPANELMLPAVLLAFPGPPEEIFTWQMALCTAVFTLFHWPCATTLLTIYKETRSKKQTAAAFFLPTAVGVCLCMALNGILQLLGA